MIDFAVLTENFTPLIVVACLIIGYIIKHATFLKWIPNDDIPTILAVCGALLNILYAGLSLTTIVFGALMGLSATGAHQSFKRFVEGSNTTV